MFIDTHTHIYLQDFEEDRLQIIDECLNNKINKLLLPNIDSSTIKDVVKLSKDYIGVCFPMVGLHPCSVKNDYENQLAMLKPYLEKCNPS